MKDISDLMLELIKLDAKTTVYKFSNSQISKASAFFKFSEIEKRMEEFLRTKEYQ